MKRRFLARLEGRHNDPHFLLLTLGHALDNFSQERRRWLSRIPLLGYRGQREDQKHNGEMLANRTTHFDFSSSLEVIGYSYSAA
jgi:hypothetical protein